VCAKQASLLKLWFPDVGLGEQNKSTSFPKCHKIKVPQSTGLQASVLISRCLRPLSPQVL